MVLLAAYLKITREMNQFVSFPTQMSCQLTSRSDVFTTTVIWSNWQCEVFASLFLAVGHKPCVRASSARGYSGLLCLWFPLSRRSLPSSPLLNQSMLADGKHIAGGVQAREICHKFRFESSGVLQSGERFLPGIDLISSVDARLEEGGM